jgi:hypothetical protein
MKVGPGGVTTALFLFKEGLGKMIYFNAFFVVHDFII